MDAKEYQNQYDIEKYRKKKKNNHIETDIQIELANWIDSLRPGPLWCASTGGARITSWVTKKLMKSVGYKKGYPDIAILEPQGVFHGLFIELKAPGGKSTTEQKIWKWNLEDRGYKALICPSNLKTAAECLQWAKYEITEYLNLK